MFEWFAELLTNTTREVVAPAMKAAAEDLCGDDAERIFTADTRELMGFFIMMRKLLLEVCITIAEDRARVLTENKVWHQRLHIL